MWVKDSWQPPAFLLENFRGCGANLLDHRHKAESQVQSPFCLWKCSTVVVTQSLRMTDCVTLHKLFHLLPRHQGLINHCKLSRDYTMLNTNRGDPRIHGVVPRGLEYSCSATPVHSLTQQQAFVSPSSKGPLLFVR